MTTSKKTRCFFSDTPLTHDGQLVYLQREETRHLQVTLRLQPGDSVRVTDGLGHEAMAVIMSFHPGHKTQLTLTQMLQCPVDTVSGRGPRLRLFAAFAAKGVMDELVEKGQELGVEAFYPLITERTVVSVAGEKEEKVLERWYKIARESAKQSGNAVLMKIEKPMTIDDAIRRLPDGDEVLLFHPGKSGKTFAEWLKGFRAVAGPRFLNNLNLWIGPEGGFTESEILKVRKENEVRGIRVTQISLGRTILRVSTAVVAALGAVKYSLEQEDGVGE